MLCYFFCVTKWIGSMHKYISLSLGPPFHYPHPTHLAPMEHLAPTEQIPCAIHQVPTDHLLHTWRCTYISPKLPLGPTLPLPSCVHMSVLYICDSTPSLEIGSSVPFFLDSTDIYVNINIQYIFLFLTCFAWCDSLQVHHVSYMWHNVKLSQLFSSMS